MSQHPRLTQADRSDHTRSTLLDTTIALLAESGWSAATVSAISDRAGVSRGAQQHHFSSKSQLVVEAAKEVTVRMVARLRELTAVALEPGDVGAALRVLIDAMSGPLYFASLELWTAARNDAELRQSMLPMERSLARHQREITEEFVVRVLAGPDGEAVDRDFAHYWADVVLTLIRGMNLSIILTADDDESRSWRDEHIVAWGERLLESYQRPAGVTRKSAQLTEAPAAKAVNPAEAAMTKTSRRRAAS